MKEVAQSLNLPIHLFGPETHMTAIVGMALSKRDIPMPSKPLMTTANFLLPSNNYNETIDSQEKTRSSSTSTQSETGKNGNKDLNDYVSISKDDVKPLLTDRTKAIVWGMQNKAVQGMLDFDHVCSRKEPSVVAMIYPFT
jgi:ATP citrate (pro-S)-lyase